MKIIFTILKTAGWILLGLVIVIVLFLTIAAVKPFAPNNYTKKTETGGEIEARYLDNGSAEISKKEYDAEGDLKKFTIYYPAELESNQKEYPVVIMVNGTGVPASKYQSVLKHLASWGFVVIGNEHPSSGFGVSTDDTYAFLKTLNEKDDLFAGKIDLNRIGLEGHSQGGAGCFTELSKSAYKDAFKTAVSLSPTGEEMAYALGWKYDASKITVPVLMMAGTNNDVIPLDQMESIYDRLQGDKVMMRRTGEAHGEMLYRADGYATAWLMWQLQDDSEAAKAFTGDNPEILQNILYQDQKVELH